MTALRKPRRSSDPLPDWIEPQLSKLVAEAPEGEDWAHEIKYDGYRMHAWFDRGEVRLLTRTGLDWTEKYAAPSRRCGSCRRAPPISTASSAPCDPTARLPSP